MGVSVLHDTEQEKAALYCNTTDQVFGPVITRWSFNDMVDYSAADIAEAFITYCMNIEATDPRLLLRNGKLDGVFNAFRSNLAENVEKYLPENFYEK